LPVRDTGKARFVPEMTMYDILPYNGNCIAVANTTNKTERYEFRLTSSDRALLTRAAELSGLRLSDFVLATLRERAEETLKKHDVIVLTGQDRLDFIDALMNPPKANAKLRRAFERHREPLL
jgi:uncharacterized protein (DUF1778 family)